jgi:hypothetical protein
MDLSSAKLIAAGLACVGMGLSSVGLGVLFVATAPDQSKLTGSLLISGFGVACLLIALFMMFVF